MKMQKAERTILKFDKGVDELCFLSKNLYNYCNYILRQSFIKTKKLPSYNDLCKELSAERQED